MTRPRPFRAVKAALTEARNLIVQLIYTVNHNTAVVAENTKLNSELLKAAQATQASVQYLEAAERHARQESGKRVNL